MNTGLCIESTNALAAFLQPCPASLQLEKLEFTLYEEKVSGLNILACVRST